MKFNIFQPVLAAIKSAIVRPVVEFMEAPLPAKIIKQLQTPAAISLIVGIFVSLGVIEARNLGILEPLELNAYDLHLRTGSVVPQDTRIVMIGITEKDIQEQLQWPMSDGVMTKLLTVLTKMEPRVIGIDIFRDIPVPPGNKRFTQLLKENKQIVAVMKFGGKNARSVNPPAILEGTDRIGFNDIVIDSDGIVRRGLLFLDDGGKVSYSFPLRLALFYLKEDKIFPEPDHLFPEYIKLGKVTFRPFKSTDGAYINADDSGYQTLISFGGGPFKRYSLGDVLSGKVEPEAIKGKIVIIGAQAESVRDIFFTPFTQGSDDRQGVYGAEMHAYITSQFLRAATEGEAPIGSSGETLEFMIILLWGLIGGVLGHLVRSPWRFGLLAATGIFAIWFFGHFLFLSGIWIPTISPALAWLASAGMVTAYMSNQEKAERALLMQIFSKHVSTDVAEDIWKHKDHFLEGGRPKPQKLRTTVLFTDLKGFTSISESMEPSALIDWLNDYMGIMTHLVINHNGVINKYIGDAIMALFGAPLARISREEIRQDAINAVTCALNMEKAFDRLNEEWSEKGLPTTSMRVGIFSGPLVAGSMGSSDRLEYTVIGDTVNIASRLESFDKGMDDNKKGVSSCRILIGEPTMELIGDGFEVLKVGEVDIKGRVNKITVYRVTGKRG